MTRKEAKKQTGVGTRRCRDTNGKTKTDAVLCDGFPSTSVQGRTFSAWEQYTWVESLKLFDSTMPLRPNRTIKPPTSGSKQTRSFVSFSSPFCPHPVSHPILFQFSSTFSSIFFYPAMISPPSHHSPTYISSFSSTSFSYSSISFCILFYLNFFFNTPFHYF